jgi:DNA-binding LacI/PurR family transcriptional regulator
VERVINDLDFRPNAIARSMAKGRSLNLACIAPNLSDYTFARIIEGAQVAAMGHGYYLLAASAAVVETFTHLIGELIKSRHTEGLLVINPYRDKRHLEIPIEFPVVLVAAASRNPRTPSVVLSDQQAGFDATKHLIDLGHSQIALITGPSNEDCVRNRTKGYLRCLSEHGIETRTEWIQQGDWSPASGTNAVRNLLNQGTSFSAVFAQNDRMALGAMKSLLDVGLRVPQDISVIGFDDMPLVSYFQPALTTVRQDMYRIGQLAAQTLIQLIEQNNMSHTQFQIPAELVIRDSTGHPGRI